ncbi:SI1L1 protein, partial [Buphagus erythrorhynchus]|nr:SI1L1 protein [Buphagus erythrorhynchus]
MTSLKRSQTERAVATGVSVGTDGTSKVHSDDFYMRRFRSQNGSLGSAVMAPVGPPRNESSHHVTSTPGVPKMGVRARIADWPPRKENIKETSRSSQDIETSSCLDSMSSKSKTGDSSIFRKLRNAKGEGELGKSSDLEDNRSEDSIKPWTCPKCFAHYDVQSILFDLNEAAINRHNVIKRRNTTTGASAAAVASLVSGPLSHSASFNSPMGSTEDLNSKGSLNMDQGDDKSNELVMSCPYFRNEIGGEGERKISLSKSNSGSFSGCESASFESTLSSHCTNAGVAVLEVPKENLILHLDRVKRY